MRTAKGLALDPETLGPSNNRWERQTLAERFWARVDQSAGPDACWPWTGCLNKKGYGSFGITSGKTELAHRVASVLTHGPLPPGLLILHKRDCPSRACCNPNHTYRGTQKQNVADAKVLGRHVSIKSNPVRGDRHWLKQKRAQMFRRPNGTMMNRAEATAALRATVFMRAGGACEACRATMGDSGHMDHMFGRAKLPQAIDNCWALCLSCDRNKTDNYPSAVFWLAKFESHAKAHGYSDTEQRARQKLDWLATKEVFE